MSFPKWFGTRYHGLLYDKNLKLTALGVLLDKALSLGADYLATGHYCQVGENSTLAKGRDPSKEHRGRKSPHPLRRAPARHHPSPVHRLLRRKHMLRRRHHLPTLGNNAM